MPESSKPKPEKLKRTFVRKAKPPVVPLPVPPPPPPSGAYWNQEGESAMQQQPQMYAPPVTIQPAQPKKKRRGRLGCIVTTLVAALFVCAVSAIMVAQTPPAAPPSQQSRAATTTTVAIAKQVATQHIVAPTHAPKKAPVVVVPTATAKPQPTTPPKPTPIPVLGITFTTASNEYVAVQTLPGATLSIKILYQCSGHYATSQSLQGTFTADSGGAMSWSWTNASSCHGGVIATVVASLNGKTVSNSASFTD